MTNKAPITPHTKRPRTEETMDPLNSSVASRNAELLKTGRFSDCTLICGDRTFAVHKAIICTASEVFRAALDGEFMEGKTGEMKLEEEEPAMLAKMLEFIYCDTYDEYADADADPGDLWNASLLINIHVYILGDKFQIPGLKKLAMGKYAIAVTYVIGVSEHFIESMRLMYTQTSDSDDELRGIAIDKVYGLLDSYIKDDEFKDLLVQCGEIGKDMLEYMMERKEMDHKIMRATYGV